MRISIFGMGYVGVISAGSLTREGHVVIGVDPVQTKVDMINKGRSPIIEKDVEELISKAVAEGLLKATTNTSDAVNETEISIVCVGTPSQLNGNLELKYIRRVCEKIGSSLKDKIERHVVVIRSTVLPGTMQAEVIPILEKYSGKRAGIDFGVCSNPEFMREGSAVYDYLHPPKTVIGETDKVSGDLLSSLYKKIDAPLIRTDIETAEMIKYTDNAWHALKVVFANEIGNICKAMGIDGRRMMEIFCQDTKLNISPYYLKPGFAFGGSCLPKDVRALTYKARTLDLSLPILNAILPSNELQVERGIQMVMEKGKKKVGVLGFSFKAGTDDLRESPVVELIERLLGKGYDIRIYDRNVKLASLIGANRDYIHNIIPHIHKMMVNGPEEILVHSETIVIGNNNPEFRQILKRINGKQTVIDLVSIAGDLYREKQYDGICW